MTDGVPTDFRLHPGIDAAAMGRAFAASGHVRLQPFLDDKVALALHHHLRARQDWRQVLNSGDKVFELDRPTRAALAVDQIAALDEAVRQGARTGFQYRYESLRLPDGDVRPAVGEDALAGFTRWMSADPVRGLLRTITGHRDVAFVDGQATAFSPGDFLTGHDDEVPGKHRRAAYVFGLTPVWRIEWGGLLLFHGENGTASGAMPAFNSLDLFDVPQIHSVSQVTTSSAYRRYSLTGWMRAKL